MATKPYIELDWDAPFDPLYGSPITLPPCTVLWRGHDTAYPAISSRPSYYSSQETASTYVRQGYKLTAFMTTRPLLLLDYRFLRNLLQRLIQTNREDKHSAELAPIMISFGLCSLAHQITLMKQRYHELLEKPEQSKEIREGMIAMQNMLQKDALLEQIGVRVGETTNDGGTMAFLKELFKGTFDGFISPRMTTAFHPNQVLHPELIVFDPVSANLVEHDNYPQPRKFQGAILRGQIKVPIEEFIKDSYRFYEVRHPSNVKMRWYMGGAVTNRLHRLDEYDRLVREDKEMSKEEKRQQKAGTRWRGKVMFANKLDRVPQVKVSPFVIKGGSAKEIAGPTYESGW